MMASSRDVESSSTELEEANDSLTCQPCAGDGNSARAVGYCLDCQEYLCQRCFDGHLIPSITRKHVLLDNEKMKDTKKTEISVSSMRCLQHHDKIVEYHCPTHDFFGCQFCSFKHQKGCKDVECIPERAKHITSSDQYKTFNTKMTGIATQCSDIVENIKQTLGTVTESHTEAISAIKAFKKEVIEAAAKLEKELMETANTFKRNETARLTTINDKVNSVLAEHQKIISKMELLENQQKHFDLYITMVQTKEKLLSLEDETQSAEDSMRRLKTTLRVSKADTDVTEMMKMQFELEILHKTSRIPPLEHVMKGQFGVENQKNVSVIKSLKHISDVNVKCNNGDSTCRIIGSVLLNYNKIILTDCYNYKVKLFDVNQSKIVSDLKLRSGPWGVCKVTNNQVAVALPGERKLVLVKIEPSLLIEREIGVNGHCCGLGYCDGKLVVSYYLPNKVEMMDLQGTVLKVIAKDQQGQLLFKEPYHVCINPGNKLIYFSNCSGNNLTCLKFDGTVVAKYTASELLYPLQVICDSSGMVYVCGRGSNNVHQVTENCKKVKVLLTSADGLSSPESICYCENASRLYISQYDNDNIKVYRVINESV